MTEEVKNANSEADRSASASKTPSKPAPRRSVAKKATALPIKPIGSEAADAKGAAAKPRAVVWRYSPEANAIVQVEVSG